MKTPEAQKENAYQIVPQFDWEAEKQEAGGIRRMTLFPVDREAAKRESLLQQVNRALQQLQNALGKMFAKAEEKKNPLHIREVPLLLFPSHTLRIFVEDYERVELFLHSSYRNWGWGYNKDELKKAQKQILSDFQGIDPAAWRICTEPEARRIFRSTDMFRGPNRSKDILGVSVKEKKQTEPNMYYHIPQKSTYSYNGSYEWWVADVYVADIPENCCIPAFLLQTGYTPLEAPPAIWGTLYGLYKNALIDIFTKGNETRIEPTKNLLDAVLSGEIKNIGDTPLDGGRLEGSRAMFESARTQLLERDYIRADITQYDPMQLEDPSRGSWELWDISKKEAALTLPFPVYARDPRIDIQEGGIIGIDFGTKSTVVVRQDDSDRIQPVRIGMGRYERKIRESDYENPTVMEFIDLESFLRAYRSREGRPLTAWRDLTVSHTAFEDWKGNSRTDFYFSFLGELKQWAGSPERGIRVRDQAGNEYSLPPYLEIREGDFDPIELYAYYIGLFINNMHTKKIYLEYLLSFPVTYPQAVRQKILQSFRRGLARSLPEAIHRDGACMERFAVTQGAGEPAAYAVCALQEYGFHPEEGELVHYGIFDFGGGTADFDFGVWRRASGAKERRYRYIIEHFGDGGDQYLGGENLLELLAFQVFKANQDTLREKGISFSLPPFCESFPGSELLISDSQEAHTNMRQMMEELRPLWERSENYESKYSSGMLKIRLFCSSGKEELTELRLDSQKLEEILRERIRQGVQQFFDALHSVFSCYELFQTQGQQRIHIFLAGNSSKSALLKEAFEQHIQSLTEQIRQEYQKRGEDPEEQTYFELYPPLGTPEAEARMKELGSEPDWEEPMERPTGKTGVAMGLVQCRSGSKIKVINEKKAQEEIRFRYWIGDDMDGYFSALLGREAPYGQWVEYLDAGERYFEFYCTTSPSAARPETLPVREAKKHRLSIPADAVCEEWCICLRAVSPNEIEYAVAKSLEEAQAGSYQSGPQKILLED